MIYWFDRIDSTNNYAKRHIGEFDNLSAVAATCQEAGRGQGDHSWSSQSGMNLTFSVIIKFSDAFVLPAKEAILITHIATSAIRKFLSTHGIESRIKWPNDIWIGDKKICGILIENVLAGQNVDTSIVGVGLNLNQTIFPDNLPNPVSAKALTGIEFDLKDSLDELMREFEAAFEKAKAIQGREALNREFEDNVFFIDSEESR